MIRAIFFDLDGTVVSAATGTYAPAVKQAFEALREKGILLVAATGRAPYELQTTKMVEGLPFDAFITLNGQYCYTEKEIICQHLFDGEDLTRILQQVEKEPFPCMMVEKADMYINMIDDHVRQVQQFVHMPLPEVRDFTHVPGREILMIMPYISREETRRLVEPVLRNSTVTRWHEYCADIVSKGVSKRSGIELLMQRYGLHWDEIMAFGDGENDYDMLQSAGCGVAMKNSCPKLLNGEFYITDHVDEDGVVTALRHFGIL